jgi:ABC-2 type transport system ATP-binding protein
MENVIEFRGVGKRYRSFALKGVSFNVPQGYIMGLIGPNGAGKTTLMKLVMNLVRRDTGEIRVFGMDCVREEARVKARIGYVPDEPACHEDIRLATLAAATAPFYGRWDAGRFRELAEEFGLPLGKKWRTLSQGMKTKFSLALALCHDAELILLDEPTSGLDPVFRRELLERLSAIIQDEHRSVLFSTHITADLERIADHVTFLRAGEVVFSAPKDEVLERWAVARGGDELGDPGLRPLFRAVRRRPHGVEALTDNAPEARRRLNSHAVVERATLEDIMVLMEKGDAE